MKHFYLHLALWSTAWIATAQTTLDPTFGTAGTTQISASNTSNHLLEDVVTTSDHKLIVYKTQENKADGSSDVVISRLLPNGTTDQNFGNQGHTTIDINTKDKVSDVVVLGHDVLLVVGTTVDNSGKPVPFATKVNTQGVVDATFGIKTYAQLNLGNDFTLSAATLSILNNRIILAGYGTNPYSGNKDFVAIAIDFRGNLVNNFGAGGYAWLNVSNGNDICTDVNIWPYSSYILLSGYSTTSTRDQFTMVLLQEDGSYNPILKNTGKFSFNVSQTGHDRSLKAAIDPMYSLAYLVGYSALGNREIVALSAVTLNGLFQPYFDFDGRKVWYIGGKNDRANNIAIAGDGNIYISGTTQQYDYSHRPFVLKLQGDGSGDGKWATNGIFTLTQSVLAGHHTGLTIQNLTQVAVASSHNPSQNTVVTRFKDISNTKARFTYSSESYCDGRIQFVPEKSEPYNFWLFGDNSSINSDPVALHQFASSGYYNVLHVYRESPDSNDQLFFQTVFVDKAPYVYTAKYNAGMIDSEHSVMVYAATPWSSEDANYTYEVSYPGSTPSTYGVTYEKAGFYPYHYTVTHKNQPENVCATTTRTDQKFIVANQYADEDLEFPQLNENLVTNGDFELGCTNTQFDSDYFLTCSGPGQTFREVSIVTDVHDYSNTIELGVSVPSSMGLQGLNGHFLYVPEKKDNLPNSMFFHSNIAYLDIWRQQVYVEEGSKYYFKTNAINISNRLADQYSFPYIVLAVDDQPLIISQLYYETISTYNVYTAPKTGWVTLRILKYEGVPVGLGSIGIDDVYFGSVVSNAGARKSVSQSNHMAQIEISPNPATAKVMINTNVDEELIANGHIEILNVATGKLLKRVPASAQTLVDVSEFATGMYLVKVLDNEGDLLGSQKLVVTQ